MDGTTVHFNISLSSAVVPMCFKTTTIVPVAKKSSVSCLNDYRPVALSSIVMKCFERLVMRHIKTLLPPLLDPLQFAYRPKHQQMTPSPPPSIWLSPTWIKRTCTVHSNAVHRLQFCIQHSHSSAFDWKAEPAGPEHLPLQLDPDFLTERPQSVRIGSSIFNITTLSTGAPQGCVLSPLLFNLVTVQITPTSSPMTQPWWVSSARTTRQHTERRCSGNGLMQSQQPVSEHG
ncbi:uncharacterized protein LOC127425445 [Myxocyprinus asiaticus]|uniref:uncharacterized protein LOC127425445 n=1 Tax=Myxocyprinus asiaticus TaxID=70543 RepID=UPI0022234E5B|nr:uncharacterized protein LOC127425445 [Myxocyprinus asiaticus]